VADVKAIGERALWLRHGEAAAMGEADSVVEQYLAAMTENGGGGAPEPSVAVVETIPNIDHRHGNGRAEILGIALLNEFGEPLHLMTPASRIVLRMSLRAHADLVRPDAGFMLRNHLGLDFAQTSAAGEGHALPPMRAGETVTIDYRLDIPELYPGAFSFSPWVCDATTGATNVCDWIDNAVTIQMARGELPVYGYLHWPCRVELSTERGLD
jgi:hypothetical protein